MKTITDAESTSVGTLVREDYRTARVFKQHKIDFCCGGGKSLAEVCKAKQVDEETLISELNAVMLDTTESAPNFDQWPLDLVVDYIEKKHHRYTESTLPQLVQYFKKLAAVHGHGAPHLVEMHEIIAESAGNLAQHMKKEELVLFPYIRKMCKAEMIGDYTQSHQFTSVATPIAAMEDEHEHEGEHFKKLEALSNGFEVPEWGCNTYAVAMQLLKEFQDDLHVHIHLENNLLFPKAMEMENRMLRLAKSE